MKAPILVINCGSSSIKFALVDQTPGAPRISGIAERLGSHDACLKLEEEHGNRRDISLPRATHALALKTILDHLGDQRPVGIGHRVVHGGERFTCATLLDDTVVRTIRQTVSLAPLHNPANLDGITATRRLFEHLPQVAVFDTAFHQTLPAHAYRYAIPEDLYQRHGIRRYGFHGSSHAYVSERLAEVSERGHGGWLIAHLGNGCSATAVWEGESQDTSMGMTPLEGLVMGTRSGDVDPGLHLHLARQLGMSLESIDLLLNQKSGLLGVSGLTNDMRELEQAAGAGHPGATLAIEVFCYRLAKSLAGLACALPRVDGIAFTGGIGENSSLIRARTLGHLKALGVHLDSAANSALARGSEGAIHDASESGSPEIRVIPTDEEGYIASQTRALITRLALADRSEEAV
ncbi:MULTISPECIES: acetate/propionate family kinase [unclassified Halomonas]|uniref:acetate/propionate family kinase n=1 Tax=Halomonas TaxID=2745 RepID=UPI001C93F22D|nr:MULTISPECIES: acetate kinase [unclassified Halomonas]MBY5924227.1 acetate kinase [Halomonas sp. DP4Y7-2]MBY6231269.1 acetate kinase [Halomonas sp. DP4Y7-1]